MSTIYLIRHGQKVNEPGDTELTKLGCSQAQQTADFLRDANIGMIFASPSRRTRQTAKIIGEALNLLVTVDARLQERMLWLDNKISRDDFLLEWAKATADRDYQPKIGDSSLATGARMQNIVEKVRQQKHKNVLFVSHGGAIIDLLRSVFNDQKLSSLLKRYPLGNLDYQCMNCAVFSLNYNGKVPELDLLNYTKHLTVITES